MRKLSIGLMAASLAWLSVPALSHAAQVITTDLIVQGSECVGFDCTSSESFGFDTLRLKENNLRINFDDTSSSASFPGNDWRININDSSNGGANYFGVEDTTAGRQIFRIEAGAPVNTLYVEDDGDVGIKTSNPVVDIHIVEGNTPTLRLDQDGSDGFTPQSWDLAGNETNFFVRDVTNGSKLPFKIRPGADDNSLVIDNDNNIGMGILDATANLHLTRSTALTALMQSTAATGGSADLTVSAIGPARLNLQNTAATGSTWSLNSNNPGNLAISTGAGEMMVSPTTGDLAVLGTISSGGTTLNVPDYVFEEDYNLMPLADLESFIQNEKHLPNIPSATEVKTSGRLNMTEMQMKLLEKVEELTLYTLEQEKTINALHARLASLEQAE